MATKKVTELETVKESTPAIVNTAVISENNQVIELQTRITELEESLQNSEMEYAATLADDIQKMILSVKERIESERPPIEGIRPYAQKLMTAGMERLPLSNPLLTRFFTNSVKRMSDVNNTTLGNIEKASGYDVALSSFLTSITWFSRGYDNENQWKKENTPATVSSGKRGNTSYKALADKITAMSRHPDVDIDDRANYAKITTNLLKGGRMAYDKMMTLVTPAAIIKAAEAAIIADKAAVVVELDLDFS